jgi:hypothetical protein
MDHGYQVQFSSSTGYLLRFRSQRLQRPPHFSHCRCVEKLLCRRWHARPQFLLTTVRFLFFYCANSQQLQGTRAVLFIPFYCIEPMHITLEPKIAALFSLSRNIQNSLPVYGNTALAEHTTKSLCFAFVVAGVAVYRPHPYLNGHGAARFRKRCSLVKVRISYYYTQIQDRINYTKETIFRR